MHKRSNIDLKKFLITISVVMGSYSLVPTAFYRGIGTHFKSKASQEGKYIYLTFDDGPSKEYTDELLDLLKKYDIKATFFVVANYAKKAPTIIERMKREGHLIGLHTLEHKNPMFMTPMYTNYEFNKSIRIIKNLGLEIKYFRPAWGVFNLYTIKYFKKNGFTPVLWNVMAEDWKGDTTPSIISKKLLNRTKIGDVVCLHDGRGKNCAPMRTIEALQKVIPIWVEQGYKFLRVDMIYEQKNDM